MRKSLSVLYGDFSCPVFATRSAIFCTVYALFLLFFIYYSNPILFFKSTIETKSQALSIANPAPCAKFGAVALAASPKMIIFLFFEYHGNDVTSFILHISVRSIVYAGVEFISFYIDIGECQYRNCYNNHCFCC